MTSETNTLRCADILVQVLEQYGVKFIFGHPGEQILPLYDALRDSSIKHILMRHEQGAVHAADGYARVSSNFGVCAATAGPGALNLTMGVATAFKDSVPMLVITGDVNRDVKGKNVFQDIELNEVFKPITLDSFYVKNAEEGILKLKEIVECISHGKTGPVHFNFPKDVLEEQISGDIINKKVSLTIQTSLNGIDDAIKLIENAERPLILAGTGIIWAHAVEKLQSFAIDNSIPVTTTYSARGVLPENHSLGLGMIGLRGTTAANFAGKNCDLLIALGCRFSERTSLGIGNPKIIHINSDADALEGDVKIQGDAAEFLDKMESIKVKSTQKWLQELDGHKRTYDVKTNYSDIPIKPQRAVKEILDATKDLTTISDAGTHTTWVNLLKKITRPSSLIFSGGFGPMGYAIPAAIGASLSNPEKKVVVVVGDGGFQMTEQELAVIAQENMKILICIINNCCLGIIKQWQDMNYRERYEVELQNPDFVKLADAYGIKAERVNAPGDAYVAVKRALDIDGPYLIDIMVDKEEGIILPKVIP
ncbi:thiamine pyrophosphate-binding protein [Methanobacterium sp. ACI-7]|uniref:thiamine pyrophosphate-binding protein n=1 Tax=unclassified Methanobacterium TaxID=2627676 RepID=UPI0039C0522F